MIHGYDICICTPEIVNYIIYGYGHMDMIYGSAHQKMLVLLGGGMVCNTAKLHQFRVGCEVFQVLQQTLNLERKYSQYS